MGSNGRIESMVRRCRRGEQAAFEVLFRQYQPRLRYYIRRLGPVDGHADDLLQNVWLKVIDKIDSLSDPKAFPAWLYTIARNEVYGTLRIKDPFVALTDEHTEQACKEEPVFDTDDAARVHRALDSLKANHREILTLNFMDDLSYEQIAEVLGVPPGTVRSRIHYAKKSLRKAMEKDDG